MNRTYKPYKSYRSYSPEETHCNFETAISIRLWTARSVAGSNASKIAEALIVAKQAQGQALNAGLGNERLSRMAS
jgi:hypothetical protein